MSTYDLGYRKYKDDYATTGQNFAKAANPERYVSDKEIQAMELKQKEDQALKDAVRAHKRERQERQARVASKQSEPKAASVAPSEYPQPQVAYTAHDVQRMKSEWEQQYTKNLQGMISLKQQYYSSDQKGDEPPSGNPMMDEVRYHMKALDLEDQERNSTFYTLVILMSNMSENMARIFDFHAFELEGLTDLLQKSIDEGEFKSDAQRIARHSKVLSLIMSDPLICFGLKVLKVAFKNNLKKQAAITTGVVDHRSKSRYRARPPKPERKKAQRPKPPTPTTTSKTTPERKAKETKTARPKPPSPCHVEEIKTPATPSEPVIEIRRNPPKATVNLDITKDSQGIDLTDALAGFRPTVKQVVSSEKTRQNIEEERKTMGPNPSETQTDLKSLFV